MNILGSEIDEYKKKTAGFIALCCVIAIVAVVVNVLLIVFHTDGTRTIFLIVNVLVDIVAGWSTFAIVTEIILPRRRTAKLFVRGIDHAKSVDITVKNVSQDTSNQSGFICKRAVCDTEDGEITVFVSDNGNIELSADARYWLYTVDNIVVRAEAHE